MEKELTREEAMGYLHLLAGNTSEKPEIESLGDGRYRASLRLVDSYVHYAEIEWVESAR